MAFAPQPLVLVNPPTLFSLKQMINNIVWRGRKVVTHFTSEIAIVVCTLGLAILMNSFFPSFVPLVIGGGTSMVLARLFVKVLTVCRIELLDTIEEGLTQIKNKIDLLISNAEIAALVFAAAIALLSTTLGVIAISILGAYKGLTAEMELYKQQLSSSIKRRATNVSALGVSLVS